MSAALEERTDEHGNVFYIGDTGDLLMPPFPTIPDFRQHARDVKEMELNPDDVIIAAFPKTGAHWVTSVTHMLMQGTTDSYGNSGPGCFLDMTPITADTIPPADKPRLFYTHFKFHHLPNQVREKKVKLIYLERNPKDTWVSWYNHITGSGGYTTGTFGHFFDLMMTPTFWYGSWFDYVLGWERDIDTERAAGLPIFVNYYEDLKKDPVGQIEKLDRFLGYNRGRALCEEIAKACNFSTMKAAKSEELKAANSSDDSGLIIYRKGEVGDWKNWFTVAQNERFDQTYNARMKGSKLRYTFV